MWTHLCILLVVLFLTEAKKQLPQFLKDLRCSLKGDVDACYVENAGKAIPILVKGLPEFDIPKMDPYQFPFLRALSTPELSVNLSNTKMHGLENLRPVKLEHSKNGDIYFITFMSKNLTVVGEYSADGKISILPMKGSGPFTIYLENCEIKVTEPIESVIKDGEEYLVSRNVTLQYNFGKISFNFDNLFNGKNKELSDKVNSFLNKNPTDTLDEFGGAIMEHMRSVVTRVIESFAENVPASDMYLP